MSSKLLTLKGPASIKDQISMSQDTKEMENLLEETLGQKSVDESEGNDLNNDRNNDTSGIELQSRDIKVAFAPVQNGSSSSDLELDLADISQHATPDITKPSRISSQSPDAQEEEIKRHETLPSLRYEKKIIAKVLSDNWLLISDKDLQQILPDEQKEKKAQLIDDLCDAYRNENDHALDNNLCKALQAAKWPLPKRQKFYDLLLKQYIKKREIKTHNFVKLLKKEIMCLKLDSSDLAECARLATNEKLKGKTLEEHIDGESNSEYKPADAFANIFKSMHNKVSYNIWMRIYQRMSAWKPHNYQKINWDKIKSILKMYQLLSPKKIVKLVSELRAYRREIEPNELIPASSELDPLEDQTGPILKRYEEDQLLSELCDGYKHQYDDQESKESVLTNILRNKLKLDGRRKKDKLNAVYDVLLHNYFANRQLNNGGLCSVLKVEMMDPEHRDDWNEDDIVDVLEVVYNSKVDGRIFVKELSQHFKSSSKFAELAKDIDGYTNNKLRPKLARLWKSIKQWKTKWPKPEEDRRHDDDTTAIHLIRRQNKDLPELPEYIQKTIWYQSWDEKIETLIDRAVLNVYNLSRLWKDPTFVELLYNDYTFYEAVEKVSKETIDTFFDDFIEENYKREIDIWNIEIQKANPWMTKKDAIDRISKIEFHEFDFNQDEKISRDEFRECLLSNGIYLAPNDIDAIFNAIDEDRDGFIVIDELEKYQPELAKQASILQYVSADPRWFVWDPEEKKYIIYVNEPIDSLLHDENETFLWYSYIPEIPPAKRAIFKQKHLKEVVNGYWMDVNDANEYDRDHEWDHLPADYLNKIFEVLNYYYNFQGKEESPLNHKKRKRSDNNINATFSFDDHDEEYELFWWNQKGRSETTAIAITKKTEEEELKYNRDQIYYLRFKYDETNETPLEWKWYDVDSSKYKKMGEYEDENKNLCVDHKVIKQLEAAFHGNDPRNFNPQQLDENASGYRSLFNSCWLPTLSEFLHQKIKVKGADMFVFAAKLLDQNGLKIVHMQQIGYTHSEQSGYPRTIARFINGNDSLLQMSSYQDSFVQRWKALFKLFTEEQEMYFWSFILCIVTEMKYIDIEIENQMVLWPLLPNTGGTDLRQSVISRLIDYSDVQREYQNAVNFAGYLVVPDKWRTNAENENTENNVSVTNILHRAKKEGTDHAIDGNDRWLLQKDDYNYYKRHFDEEKTIMLRMADVIRKFLLESELKNTALWPWFQNSKFCANGNSMKLYNELMTKFNLIHEFHHHDIVKIYNKEPQKQSEPPQSNLKTNDEVDEQKKGETENESNQSIRHKRKFAAIQLLRNETERNLNYLRHYFNVSKVKWLQIPGLQNYVCENTMRLTLDGQMLHIGGSPKNNIYIIDLSTDELNDIRYSNVDPIFNTKRYKKNPLQFWKNSKPHNKPQNKPDPDDLEPISFDKITFLFFERFMMDCFVERDKKMFERNIEMKKYHMDTTSYRIFIDSWRNIPDFWKYEHDILLMELVLKYGIDCNAIAKDIDEQASDYKSRFNYVSHTLSTTEHPVYAFQTWCKDKLNLLHRLQYVVKTIINTLNDAKNTEANTIFSSYQKESHLEFVKRDKWTFITKEDYEEKQREEQQKQSDKTTTIINEHETDVKEEEKDIEVKVTEEDNEIVLEVNVDIYIPRNIEIELFESLQAFDLKQYGPAITRFVIHDKLTREPEDSHCTVLGQLLYSLPDPIAIEILWESKDILQKIKPDVLKKLCLQIQNGSIFKPSTCLSIAEFFDELAQTDLVQADKWGEFSKKFENNAFEDVAKIENNHMLFVLLNVPLANHEGRCLIQLAQEGARVRFLNTERISDVINHMYRRGHLKINKDLKPKPRTYAQMLHTISRYPFRFYLSPQGYHWVGGMLYAEYLVLLFSYAYYWPIRSEPICLFSEDVCLPFKVLEILFWFSNFGYILFEFHEFSEKGIAQYFNLAMMGDANVMDALVSIMWIVLCAMRIGLALCSEPGHDLGGLEKAYTFFFGIAILFMAMRGIKILSISQYFGALILIIKSMAKEMVKFVLIYVLMMIAVLFALRFMSEEVLGGDNMWRELLEVFEFFIGAKPIYEMDAAFDDWTKIYLVIGVVLGSLLLFNLWIALMVAKYESAQEQADADVMLNKTELSVDLLQRSRHMPPPLNFYMYIITFVVWFFSFIVSLVSLCSSKWYSIWTIFQYIHYGSFEKLRTLNIWYFWYFLWCECKYDYLSDEHRKRIKSNDEENKLDNYKRNHLEFFDSINAYDLLQWYWIEMKNVIKLFFNVTILILNTLGMIDVMLSIVSTLGGSSAATTNHMYGETDTSVRMLHKGCYGRIKRFSEDRNLSPIDGISMSKYLDKHQQESQYSVPQSDKIMLNKLTAQTLFCPHCYQPFLTTEEKMKKQLVSPYTALFDYMSAIVFVLIPIAWIPLLIIIFFGAVKDLILGLFDASDRVNENYSNKDYDRNYFPKFMLK